jgi:acyl carrier protein
MIDEQPQVPAARQATDGWGRRPPTSHVGTLSAEIVQLWLIEQLAERLGLPIDEIDVREKFASYGLDSRSAVEIAGELEDWTGLEVEPTLVWDFPTIEAVTKYLIAQQQEDPRQAESPTEV